MNTESNRSQVTEALREAQLGFRHLIRSELRLASAELQVGASSIARGSTRILVFVGLLVWTLPFLTAFLIIGFGDLLGGRYWLSALCLAVLTSVIGGIGLSISLRRTHFDDLTLPRTRRTLSREMEKAA